MSIKKYKAAVIGCGNIGASKGNYNKIILPNTHAGAYQLNKRTKLVALVENNKSKLLVLTKNYPGVKIFNQAEEMLKEIKPDIVSVATPAAFHYKYVMLAARYKCPAILCEKPIAENIKHAKQMIAACRRAGSLLFINHQRRFDQLLNNWSEKVKDGFLGKIFQGNAYYYNGLFNNSTHLIDLLSMFLGQPDWLLANYNLATSNPGKDKNVDGLINYSGVTISLQSLSKNYGYFGFNLFGGKGMLAVTNLGYEVHYRKKINNKYFNNFFELSETPIKQGRPRSFFKAVITNIVACLDGLAKPKSKGQDGLAALKILIDLKKSAEQGGRKIVIKY